MTIKAQLFAAEIKSEDDTGTFSGYASTYGVDLQGDRVEPGAFGKTINKTKGRIPVFMNHDDLFVGLTTKLAEDPKGLAFTAKLLTETTRGKDAYELLKALYAHDYKVGMSIGFRCHVWDMDGAVRVLKEVELFEASITPFPAQPKARVEDVKSVRDLEQFLRESGCSKSEALRLIATARGGSDGGLRDAEPLRKAMRNERLILAARAAI